MYKKAYIISTLMKIHSSVGDVRKIKEKFINNHNNKLKTNQGCR